MAIVQVKGVFMGAQLKKSSFDGKETSAIYIDVYQPDSTVTDKTVQLKSDEIELIAKLNKDYAMGSSFECTAKVNAYKNKAYFKLEQIIA